MTTPASTPADSTPRIAATAIQKSNLRYPVKAPHLGYVDHPEQDRIDDRPPPSTAFGRSENSGASAISVREDKSACDERGGRRSGPGRLVQGTGGQAGRDRHSLEHACAHIGHALRGRFLVDVDAIAVARSEGPGVARGLREPDHGRATEAMPIVDRCVLTSSKSGSAGVGRPRGMLPTSSTP